MSDLKRYARQMRLPDVGREMQQKLRASSVCVAGSSTSARVCALYLAGAGVGRINASESIADELRALNPDIEIDTTDDVADVGANEPGVADLDPAAADVANGALQALGVMKRIFADA